MQPRIRSLSPFIDPATPVLVPEPPLGPEWLHEIKWDGYRMQVHIGPVGAPIEQASTSEPVNRQRQQTAVRLFNRRGQDCTHRYPRVVEAVASVPAFSAILDCELVAMGKAREDFWRIRSAGAHLQLVCFDVMVLDGEDLRALPLLERKAKLRALVSRSNHDMLAYSDHFTDALALLRKAEALGLEGIVSKRGDLPYRSGNRCGWRKVKTAAWLKANANRPDVFAKLVRQR